VPAIFAMSSSRKSAVRFIRHFAHLAGVDEQNLARPVAKLVVTTIARDDPHAHWYLRCVEELARQRDHAVDEATVLRLNQILSNFPFAALIRGHRTIRHDERGDAGWREMEDEVLNPGVVRVPRWRDAVAPALVVA
jgi:hypothetical protein